MELTFGSQNEVRTCLTALSLFFLIFLSSFIDFGSASFLACIYNKDGTVVERYWPLNVGLSENCTVKHSPGYVILKLAMYLVEL